MRFKTHNFLKFFLILVTFIIVSCSKNFENNTVKLFFPKKIAKIDGTHALFIKKNSFDLKENITSDDCESWAMNLDLDKLFLNSFTELTKKMFHNIKIIEGDFDASLKKNKKYNSVIVLEKNVAYVDFKTEGNKGIFTIVLDSNFKIKANKKEVNNNLNSKQNWQKNIFLNCYLPEGAKKATEEAFKILIKEAYSSIYESVFAVTR